MLRPLCWHAQSLGCADHFSQSVSRCGLLPLPISCGAKPCRERLKAEEEREARRSARFGESVSARQRMGDPTFGGRAKEGRWDFLGYYELLGLKPAGGHEQVQSL